MSKLIICLICFFLVALARAQNTYYWVGVNTKTDAILTGADWNTQQDGLGATRATANDHDILIVNGSKNLEFHFEAANTIRLKRVEVSNNSSVAFINSSVSSVININVSGDDNTKSLLVSGNSTLVIRSKIASFLNFNITKGGEVDNSIVRIVGDDLGSGSYGAARFGLSKTEDKLIFSNGSKAYAESTATAFGGNTSDNERSVVFEEGTSLYFIRGNSPFGNSNVNNPLLNLKRGSNFIIRGISTNGNMFNNRSFGNLIIENGIAYTLTGSSTFASVNDLIVRENSKLELPPNISAFTSKVSGNILIESGSEFAVTSNSNGQTTIEMNGDGALQTINGTISSLNMFKVASGANVKLNTNLSIAAARDINIEGVLDLSSHVLSGVGRFKTVSGATLISAHTDGLGANIVTTGNQTYAEGTNYIFNAATETAFPEDVSGITLNAIGNLTFNAKVSINRSIITSGNLTLHNEKLTIANNASITMLQGANFAGTYNDNAYIVALNNGCACSSGTIFVEGITSTTLIPVGTANHYIPVTVEASVASNFSVNVFGDVTVDATPDGIPIGDKTYLVNATWKLSRTSGNGNFSVQVSWPDALEGFGFSGLANNQIGISRLNGLTYDNFRGTGNNTANTVKISNLTQNGPIIVGGVGTVLPVELVAFNAQKNGSTISLRWTTSSERNSSYFKIERFTDGTNFAVIGTKRSIGNTNVTQNYALTDFSPVNGTNYYRLLQYDNDGRFTTYLPEAVNFNYQSNVFQVVYNQHANQISFKATSDTEDIAIVSVFDMKGKKVLSKKININKGSNMYLLETPNLKGVYALSYLQNNILHTEKLIK